MKPVLLLCGVLLAGCATHDPKPGLTDDELVQRLTALGVGVHTYTPPDSTAPAGGDNKNSWFLEFTQPLDHNDPSAGTFQQEVVLVHHSTAANTPTIVYTNGYATATTNATRELAALLDANQIIISTRYSGVAVLPDYPTQLTIAQAAADEHAILAILHQVYDGAFVSAGQGAGGQMATYHRRFYPDDVVGTVAYTAPLSLAAPDPRYTQFFTTIGPADCRAAVHQLPIEMLAHRRAALEALARADRQVLIPSDAVPVGLERGVEALEWAFWEYSGASQCAGVPPITASDAELYTYLSSITGVGFGFSAFTDQVNAQLGFAPDNISPDLAPYLQFANTPLPTPPGYVKPAYDPDVMLDIQSFVQNEGDRLLFVYGQWDPWTAGAYQLGAARDAAEFFVPNGDHNVRMVDLAAADRARAFQMLEAWTGVTPLASRVTGQDPRELL